MATDKPRITAYVRQDLFDKFNQFCEEYQVKHSKGIELILAEYFTSNIPDVTLNPLANMGVSEDRLKALIDERLEVITLGSNTSVTPKETITTEDLDKAIASLSNNQKFIEAIASKVAILVSAGESPETSQNPLPSVTRDDLEDSHTSFDIDTANGSEGLTDGKLSKLIKCDRAMLYRWRTQGKPQRPSQLYKDVMNDWEFKGDRWYRRSGDNRTESLFN